MVIIDWLLIGIALLVIILIYKVQVLIRLQAIQSNQLQTLDQEVFHIAQEQNPNYGYCTNCGTRAYVRHVIPKGEKQGDSPDIFYCKACWWLSDSVDLGYEELEYRNRKTERDIMAARVGPK